MPSLPSKTSPSSGQAHTPGPWLVHNCPNGSCNKGIWARDGHPDDRDGPFPICADVRTESDARLIAAAPELLKALEKHRDNYMDYFHGQPIRHNPEALFKETVMALLSAT